MQIKMKGSYGMLSYFDEKLLYFLSFLFFKNPKAIQTNIITPTTDVSYTQNVSYIIWENKTA